MLRLTVLVAFLASLNSVLTDSTSNATCTGSGNEICPKSHEYYDKCPPDNCPPSTCEVGEVATFVACKPPSDPSKCKPSCVCDPGYFRTVGGECVTLAKCPPRCGLNEVVSDCANSPCIRNCATKDLNLQCKPYPPGCKSGCVCADNYLRDYNGVCVPTDKCPSNKPICSKKEVYSDCPNKGCSPKRCDELGFPLKCAIAARNNTSCGTPGCICKSGMLRNKNGECVNVSECPSCGGDKNATVGGGSFCTRCSNYKNKKRICALSFIQNGCACRPKYVYDEKSRKCVLPENCPLTCGPNEVLSECGNNGCLSTCAEPDRITYCDYDPSTCKPGCICAEGWLRNENNVCVPRDKCPPTLTCGPNEVVSECGNNGCLSTCAEPNRIAYCDYDPSTCKPGCVCEEGWLRNENNVCVPRDKCPPTTESAQ